MPSVPAKTFVSLLGATAMIVLAVTPQPASAGGRVGITVTPRGQDAEILRTGLQLYSLARNLRDKNKARVSQKGNGNGAAISQSGSNNWASVFQRGRGNSGTITQNGDDNAYALFQFGKKQTTSVTQNGNGNVGARFEWGW